MRGESTTPPPSNPSSGCRATDRYETASHGRSGLCAGECRCPPGRLLAHTCHVTVEPARYPSITISGNGSPRPEHEIQGQSRLVPAVGGRERTALLARHWGAFVERTGHGPDMALWLAVYDLDIFPSLRDPKSNVNQKCSQKLSEMLWRPKNV